MPEPILTPGQLGAICAALGNTQTGLTGSEIGAQLAECGIDDPGEMTKRTRLSQALSARQRQDGTSNNVIAFVRASLDPARYVHRQEFYTELRKTANEALAFAGYFLVEDGSIRRMAPAKTIGQAIGVPTGLRAEMERRHSHPAVVSSCYAELLQENYVHAVFEAAKGIAEELRAKSGSAKDGWELVDYALEGGPKRLPRLALNSLQSDTDWAEQRGLSSLLKGLFSMFRNPPAHTPRSKSPLTRDDALDALTLISLIQRRIDRLVPTKPASA